MLLDDPAAATSNGTQLQVWNCNGNVRHGWPLRAAQAPPPPPPTGPVSSQLVEIQHHAHASDNPQARPPPAPGQILRSASKPRRRLRQPPSTPRHPDSACASTPRGSGRPPGPPLWCRRLPTESPTQECWAGCGSSHALSRSSSERVPGRPRLRRRQQRAASVRAL